MLLILESKEKKGKITQQHSLDRKGRKCPLWLENLKMGRITARKLNGGVKIEPLEEKKENKKEENLNFWKVKSSIMMGSQDSKRTDR